MMYTAKVSGFFTETRAVEAEDFEQAKELFAENKGEVLTVDFATDIEVAEVAEVEDDNGDVVDEVEVEVVDAEIIEPEQA